MEVTSTRSLSKTLETKSGILCLESLPVLHYPMLIGGNLGHLQQLLSVFLLFYDWEKKLRRKEEVGVCALPCSRNGSRKRICWSYTWSWPSVPMRESQFAKGAPSSCKMTSRHVASNTMRLDKWTPVKVNSRGQRGWWVWKLGLMDGWMSMDRWYCGVWMWTVPIG